jgi:hypothetical protein
MTEAGVGPKEESERLRQKLRREGGCEGVRSGQGRADGKRAAESAAERDSRCWVRGLKMR